MTTDELRREWVRLLAVGKEMSQRLCGIGISKVLVSDEELAALIEVYRQTEREWDRIDDLLLDREADERDAAELAELPGFGL